MIDTEEVLHRGVQIMHMDRIPNDVVAELVGLAVDMTTSDAATSHPEAEAAGVMVAPVGVFANPTLTVGGATKLAAPDDERVFEQSALLEILDEPRRSLVGLLALVRDAARKAAVVVPALVEELHEAHAFLDKSAGLEAVRGERTRCLHAVAIHREGRWRFLGKVGHLRHAGLHPVGHLSLRKARVDFRIEFGVALVGVELAERVEHATAGVGRDAFRVRQEEHRFCAGLELHPLVFGRQEARTPEARVERLILVGVLRDQNDEGRQVFVHAAQTIGSPGTHRGPTGHLVAGAEERNAGVVVDRFRVHRADDTELIGQAAGMAHDVAVFDAALPVPLEINERARQRERGLVPAHAGQTLSLADRVGQWLQVLLAEERLRVERLELRRTARLEQVDDALGLGREVRALRQRRSVGLADDPAHREGTETQGRGSKEMPTRGAHQMVVGRKLGGHGQREVTAESLARMVEQTRVRAAKAGSDEIFDRAKSGAGAGAGCVPLKFCIA